MKERGFVKSIQDKKDSRKQILSLTPKSRKLLPKFEVEWTNIQKILDDCTTEDFLENILFFENKLNEKSLVKRLQNAHENLNQK